MAHANAPATYGVAVIEPPCAYTEPHATVMNAIKRAHNTHASTARGNIPNISATTNSREPVEPAIPTAIMPCLDDKRAWTYVGFSKAATRKGIVRRNTAAAHISESMPAPLAGKSELM